MAAPRSGEKTNKLAMQQQALQKRAGAMGRDLAWKRRERFVETFDDSLAGDIARFSVMRRLRREKPELEFGEIVRAVERELDS